MEELPKVYVNPINKEFKNFQNDTNTRKSVNKLDTRNLSMKLKDILASSNYIYKKKLKIHYNNTITEEVIIGKTKDYILTIDGKKIKLIDIYDIEYA